MRRLAVRDETAHRLAKRLLPVLDRRDSGRRPGAVPEHAVSRPGRRTPVLTAGGRLNPIRVRTDQAEHFLREPEPARLARAGGMVDPRAAVDPCQRDELARNVAGPGRLAVLVGDDVDCGLACLQPDHRADEVGPVLTV